MKLRGRLGRLALVLFVVLASGACRVRTDVGLRVNDDGSGQVSVTITLDADAVKHAPTIASTLKIDDLKQTGWTVTQVPGTDGSLSFTATKPFANPSEADAIFTEISGPTGPFRDFHLTRSRSFARTTTGFTGTIDFKQGLASFADQELATALDGQPLGDDVKAIEARIGDSLDNVFQFRLAVRLPGEVTSNAPGQASNGAEWQPRLSESSPVPLQATGKSWRVGTLVATGVGMAAFVALVVLVVFRLALRSTAKRRPTP